MNTVDRSQPDERASIIECPNCGAAARPDSGNVCHFCDAVLVPPGPPAAPLYQPPTYLVATNPPPGTGSSNGKILLIVLVLVVVGSSAARAITALVGSTSSVTSPTVTMPTTTTMPTLPAIETEHVDGNLASRTLDCSTGQSYTIEGNVLSITAAGGVCDTIIVSGTTSTVRIAAVRHLWVNGSGNNIAVSEVGAITSFGSVNQTTWTAGIDGQPPTIVTANMTDKVSKG